MTPYVSEWLTPSTISATQKRDECGTGRRRRYRPRQSFGLRSKHRRGPEAELFLAPARQWVPEAEVPQIGGARTCPRRDRSSPRGRPGPHTEAEAGAVAAAERQLDGAECSALHPRSSDAILNPVHDHTRDSGSRATLATCVSICQNFLFPRMIVRNAGCTRALSVRTI